MSAKKNRQDPARHEGSLRTINKFGLINEVASSSSPACTSLVRKREQKWCDMLKDWDNLMTNNYNKVRKRCRKGIPHSVRAAAWIALCGAANLQQQNPGLFEELLTKESECMVYIEKDLPRTYQLHELFEENGGLGQTEMRKVLKAYSVYNPNVGYVSKRNDVQSTHYALVWLKCGYTNTLPWNTVLRVWDMFLCEGTKVLIKTGITILLLVFSDKKVREDCNRNPEKTLEYLLHRLPEEMLAEDFFINKLLSLDISEEQFKEARLKELDNIKKH